MKQWKKALFALVLAVVMVCGMLTPAFAWRESYSRLRSPNGEYWFDTHEIVLGRWMRADDPNMNVPDMTVYSQDGVVWFTPAGLAQYKNITETPDGSWMTTTLNNVGYQSPDGGMMWMITESFNGWNSWSSYYPADDSATLYGTSDSYVMRTVPFDGYTRTYNAYEFGPVEDFTGTVYYTLEAHSDSFSGILLRDGNEPTFGWMSSVYNWGSADPQYPSQNNDFTLYPCVSFDPQMRTFTQANPFLYPDRLEFVQTAGSYQPYHRHDLNLKTYKSPCSVRMRVHLSAPPSVFCAVDLAQWFMMYPQLQISAVNGYSGYDPGAANLSLPVVLNNGSLPYRPIRSIGGQSWAIDSDLNGIITETDQLSSPDLLGDPVTPVQSLDITMQIPDPEVCLNLPMYVWEEGQSPYAAEEYPNADAHIIVTFEREPAQNESIAYPFLYTLNANENTVTITGFASDYFLYGSYAFDPNGRLTAFSYDPVNRTMTLPERIDGFPVTAIQEYALLGMADMAPSNESPIPEAIQPPREIIVPATVCSIGARAFGPTIERVHVPYLCAVNPDAFVYTSHPLTICCDLPNSLAERTLPYYGYTYVVCDTHGSSHMHMYDEVITPAGCTAGGYSTFTCSECGDSYVDNYTNALGHSFCCYVSDGNATCTQDGTMTGTCERCGATNTIPEDGSAGHVFGGWEYLDEKGHVMRCARCGEKETEPHNFDETVTSPNCFDGGFTLYECSVCGYSYTADETNALGHSFTNYVSDGNATCTQDGTKTAVCDREYCDVTDTIVDTATALGHFFTDYVPDGNATCTEDGTKTAVCDNGCGETYTMPDEGSALGHDFGAWVVTTQPTETEDGEETRTCTRCGANETRPVDRLSPTASFKVTGGRAKPGRTVQVTVSVQNNPGIVATRLHLTYDPQVLTLTAVDNGDVFDDAFFQPGGNLNTVPFTTFWKDALGGNHTADGTLVTYTFLVDENAQPGVTTITVDYDADSTFNSAMQAAAFAVENDSVEVYLRKAGDSNGDGKLDTKDVVALSRYLAGGWGVEIDEASADVDGDGKVTLRDVVLMERYLAGGWGVELI